jgi:hypothetical protein
MCKSYQIGPSIELKRFINKPGRKSAIILFGGFTGKDQLLSRNNG